MKRTAFGWIRPDGAEPALRASIAPPPWMRAKASAIWLRLAFSTQTNRTRFIGSGSWHGDLGTASCESPRALVDGRSAAAGIWRAAGGALVDLRLRRARIRSAGRATGRAGRIGGVVTRSVADGVEGFPARALRVFGPQLVRVRIAADGAVFRHHAAASGVQARAERGEFVGAVDLQAEMVDARRAAGAGDREVDARVFQHPLGVVVLDHAGLRGEQPGVEADAAGEVGDVEVHVEAVHRLAPVLRGLQGDAGPQSAVPAQQFSVRQASSAF